MEVSEKLNKEFFYEWHLDRYAFNHDMCEGLFERVVSGQG